MRKLLLLTFLLAAFVSCANAQGVLVQSCQNHTITGTTASCTQTYGSGHIVVVGGQTFGGNVSGPSISDTAGFSFTSIGTAVSALNGSGPANDHWLPIWCANTGVGGSNAITVTNATSGQSQQMTALEYSGASCNQDGGHQQGNPSNPNVADTSLTTSSLGTSHSDLLIVFASIFASDGSSTFSAGSGYTLATANAFNGATLPPPFIANSFVFVQEHNLNAIPGSYVGNFSTATNQFYLINLVALKLGPPGVTGVPRKHGTFINYRPTPHFKIPWDDRRHRLQVERI